MNHLMKLFTSTYRPCVRKIHKQKNEKRTNSFVDNWGFILFSVSVPAGYWTLILLCKDKGSICY